MRGNIRYEQGIGLVASIIILAVIAVGGYAAVKVSQRSQVEVDTSEQEQVIADVRTDVQNTLSGVEADLRANADLAVDAAIAALTNLSARIQEAALTVESSAQAELNVLRADVDSIRATLETDASSAQAKIVTVLEDVSASIEAEGESSTEVEVGMEEESEIDEDGSTSTDAEASVDAEAEVDDDGAEAEAEGSLEIDL